MSNHANVGMKIDEVRSRAQSIREGSALVLHDIGDVDAEADSASAAWGEPAKLDGYDVLQLLVEYTAGTTTTGVTIEAQVSPYRADSAQLGSAWYDLYVIDRADGSTVLWQAVFTSALAAAQQGRFAAVMPLDGARWIRFKVYTPGADQSGARVVLRGLPNKLSV